MGGLALHTVGGTSQIAATHAETPIPTIVINLARSTERKLQTQTAFHAVGVDVRFHVAFDGTSTDFLQSPHYDRANRIARYGADLSSREIACYLSHLSAMQYCLQTGIERAIILEDDVRPEPSFVAAVRQLAHAPECFEFVRLYGLRRRRKLAICALTEAVDLVWPKHGLSGAQGYYLTASAMRKILAGGKVVVPFDMMIDRYWRTGVTVFALHPYVIREVDNGTSDIGKRTDMWSDGSYRLLRARLRVRKLIERAVRTYANLIQRLRISGWRKRGILAFAVRAARSGQ